MKRFLYVVDSMDDNLVFQLYNLIYGILVNATPVDTRNLLNHTIFSYDGKSAEISISAPKVQGGKMTDYFPYVNYKENLRNGKPNQNYHYVEKAIIQACEIFAERIGGVVVNEL